VTGAAKADPAAKVSKAKVALMCFMDVIKILLLKKRYLPVAALKAVN
jgi:hypothetical protein